MKEAVIPKETKTIENPTEKKIVFNKTDFLSLRTSSKVWPEIYEIYPGIKGKTQGDKKLINPPANAINKFKIT